MKHLTTCDNLKKEGARFTSDKLDVIRIEPYIDESEQMNLKPQIGDALFIDLIRYINADDKSSFPDYSTLLNGGIYDTVQHGATQSKQFKGLIKALNYYVWARVVKNNNYTLTRFGLVNKIDDRSNNAELKERLVVEKDALTVADEYLSGCIQYLQANKDKFPLFTKGIRRNRLRISIIGD